MASNDSPVPQLAAREPERRPPAVACALLLVLAASGSSPAQVGGKPSPYFVYHFKQVVPLELDIGRIAVFTAPGSGPAEQVLAALGIAADSIESWPISGWSLVHLRDGLAGAPIVEDLVSRIAADPGGLFASPVYVDGGDLTFMTRDILVRFDPGVDAAEAESILHASGAGTVLDRDWAGMKGAYRLRTAFRSGLEVLTAANALAERPEIRFSEPDAVFTGSSAHYPNDPYFGDCWQLYNSGQAGGTWDMDLDGPEAWDLTTGDPSVVVVVIDDGVQQNHPDINQVQGMDFTQVPPVPGGGPVLACDMHGTTVAGCITARIDNNVGIVGAAPDCIVASARVFVHTISNPPCSGAWTSQRSWTVDALAWAESIGARVTNNSNGYGPTGQHSSIDDKYWDTYQGGMLHFAAAGNAGAGTINYPARLPGVNAVGAVDRNGNKWNQSNFGTELRFVAPGVDVETTDLIGAGGYNPSAIGDFGDYTKATGTSYASPLAAGVAALVLSRSPWLTPPQVESILMGSCLDLETPGWDENTGWGFLNAYMAVSAAISTPTSYCVPKVNSLGCAPFMWSGGFASASMGCCFTLGAQNVINFKNGILFYGTNGPNNAPFQGGTLCVKPPLIRSGVLNSGGNPPPANDCSGVMTFDFNQYIAMGVDPALVPGAWVFAQYWSRDPADFFSTSLTDAMQFMIGP